MRQTSVIGLCHKNMKLLLCAMLLVLSCISLLHADVAPQNIAVNTTFPGSGNRINSGGYVDLAVTWQGDTPPFTARFLKDGNVISSDSSISGNSTNARISASTIGDTGGSPTTITVEIVDSSNRSSTAQSQGIIVDTLAPVINATVTNGPTFSPTSSVRIQITSNKEINAPTVTCEGVSAAMEGSLTTGTSFVYNLQLSTAFSNGPHSISVSAKDTTEPSASANTGNTSVTFQVGTSSTGPTTINSATPGSPTNASSVTLAGTSPSGVNKIQILDGGSEVAVVNTSNTNWSVSIQPNEGTHSYVAVSFDVTEQEISRSSAFPLIVDRTAPSVPVIDTTSPIPPQTNANSQVFSINVADYANEVSAPVYLQGYNNGTAVGQRYNVTTAGSPLNATIPLTEGTNSIFFRTIDSAGNESANSETVSINKSGSANASISSAMVDSYPIPAPTTSMLGGGSHSLTFNFNQAVGSTIPTVEIICGGGAKISVTPTWTSTTVLSGTFTIPSNGGVTYDGAATVSVKGVVDTFGNNIAEYTQEAAFSIDSTPPISTINGNSAIYLSATNNTANLSGTVNDGNGSGIDFLTLIVRSSTGEETTTNIPLQTGAQSPWSYTYTSSLTSGEYTLVTTATDRAIPSGNAESAIGKTGLRLIVDTEAPVVQRISLNNTGIDISTYGEPLVIASDVSRLVAVASDNGSGLDLTSTNYIFTLTGPNGLITGEKTNNGADTIYFDFPTLTESGDYTVTVTPVDKAGNTGESQTRKFTINKSAPDAAEFAPPGQTVANNTEENLAQSQIKVTLSATAGNVTPSYARSTISVKYNGVEVGAKQADEAALIAKLHNGNLAADGSHDGNYYTTVIPYSSNGIAGTAINSNFTYDTLPPVVTDSYPSITANEPWFGTSLPNFSITVSDAPKDILEHYNGQYSSIVPKMPGDVTWYNGSGSGINHEVSTFTWKMGEQTPTNANRIGSKMTVNAPTAPTSDNEAGVADVEVTITLADSVTQGATIPNTNTITRIFKYDYAAPAITIDTANGKKFCKNTLTVRASAEDTGSDEDLQVTAIEYSEDNGANWNDLSVSSLPAKSASFNLSINIANKAEGTYAIKFRARDRGGNTSPEASFSYVIDRTPPAAPELTIPLPDYTVNKRTQSFKWASSNGADNYVIQISDDSSFNNVLNTQSNTGFPSLLGTVTTTTDSSFSLPKDGTFYWRVASLEKCEDGYNISSFSETRKMIVDSVKPRILSVNPSPSTSNTVSTGMVTFTIRFSEILDATVELTATLTSAGGQVMKIEKISCTGDTWTGTTVIPKNNSAVYDGTGVISVSGAKDIAGNTMDSDNSNTIIINTGPAFTTKLFSNPANEYEITIITKASESLQTAPSCYVKQNSVKTPVTMSFLKDRFYSGSYKIDRENPGSAYITMSGTDLYGMVGNSTVQFIIADVNASVRLNVSTDSGKANLKAAENSTYQPTSIFMIERESLESPFGNGNNGDTPASIRASAGVRASNTSNNSDSELVGVLGLEDIGPKSTKLRKCMLYTADLNGEVINADSSKVHLYRQGADGSWVFQGGEIRDRKISAQLTGLGRLALMADNTAPRMTSMSPANLEKLESNTPEIKGQFVDKGSGLVTDSFKLYIDGLQVQNVTMDSEGRFNYRVRTPLKEGKHEILCEALDKAGNALRKAITIEAAPLISVGEFRPYPSPARSNHIYFAYNFGAIPDSVSLKIYDSAGHLVEKFDSSSFTNANGKLRWDLIDRKGRRAANGAYFYRLEASSGGTKVKKRGKFAILR